MNCRVSDGTPQKKSIESCVAIETAINEQEFDYKLMICID